MIFGQRQPAIMQLRTRPGPSIPIKKELPNCAGGLETGLCLVAFIGPLTPSCTCLGRCTRATMRLSCDSFLRLLFDNFWAPQRNLRMTAASEPPARCAGPPGRHCYAGFLPRATLESSLIRQALIRSQMLRVTIRIIPESAGTVFAPEKPSVPMIQPCAI